jgi:hypothetical protein
MTYIQRFDGKNRETVDQFESRREAQKMLREYQISDPSANYYLSSRACKGWD